MRLILFLNMLFLILHVAEGTDKSLVEVPAHEILINISKGMPVEYDHIIIKGHLDLRNLDLPTKRNIDGTDVKIIGSPIRITDSIIDEADFKSAILENITNFKSSTFNGPAYFESTTFNGPAYFSYSTFNSPAHFSYSTFNSPADFTNSKFNSPAYFSYSTFNSPAHFSYSTFNSDAHFSSSTFNNNANYLTTTFNSPAYFSSSKFNGPAYFSNSTFNGNAYFGSSTFNSTACFRPSTFNGIANFANSNFNNIVDFSSSTFNNTVDFSSSTFNSTANFRPSTFNNTTNFSNSNFNNIADFSSSTFKNTTNFSNSNFNNIADFSSSTFNNAAYFMHSTFNNAAYFLNSTFNRPDFSETQFKKVASFKDSRFNGATSLDSSHFYEYALFENVKFNGTLSLIRTKYDDKLFIRWSSISRLVYDDAAYFSLLKNFKDLGYLDDYDLCYFEYRREHRGHDWLGIPDWEEIIRKAIDYPLQLFYGYGTKPLNAFFVSLGIIIIFGIFWRTLGLGGPHDLTKEKLRPDQDWVDSIIDILGFSVTVFLSGTRFFIDPPAVPEIEGQSRSLIKTAFITERLLGALFSILFFIAISSTIVRSI
jgi:hypothetical protein